MPNSTKLPGSSSRSSRSRTGSLPAALAGDELGAAHRERPGPAGSAGRRPAAASRGGWAGRSSRPGVPGANISGLATPAARFSWKARMPSAGVLGLGDEREPGVEQAQRLLAPTGRARRRTRRARASSPTATSTPARRRPRATARVELVDRHHLVDEADLRAPRPRRPGARSSAARAPSSAASSAASAP